MSEGKWSRLSPAQRMDIWSRGKAGQPLHKTGRAEGRPHNSIGCLWLLCQGRLQQIAGALV